MTAPVRAACVIGWPVEHSRSPLIHNYWLKHYGITGEYRREAVPPDKFEEFVQSLAAHGYVGANVTVPHKETALAVSLPDEQRAGGRRRQHAVDRRRTLHATNTDVEGFLNNLDASAPQWDRGLRQRGRARRRRRGARGRLRPDERNIERITVVNRTPHRAEALRERFRRTSAGRRRGNS